MDNSNKNITELNFNDPELGNVIIKPLGEKQENYSEKIVRVRKNTKSGQLKLSDQEKLFTKLSNKLKNVIRGI